MSEYISHNVVDISNRVNELPIELLIDYEKFFERKTNESRF